ESPFGRAAFETAGAFDDQEIRRRLGFSLKSLDRLIHAESYTDAGGWMFSVLHTMEPIDDLTTIKKALGLTPGTERAIRGQEYFEITRNKHWFVALGRLSLATPSHIRLAQPGADAPLPKMYFRLHDRQTMIVGQMHPMRLFLEAEGRFEQFAI